MATIEIMETKLQELHYDLTKAREALDHREDNENASHARLVALEKMYRASGEDESVGKALDKAYDEYDEAYQLKKTAEDIAEAIEEAIEKLTETIRALEILEAMGL